VIEGDSSVWQVKPACSIEGHWEGSVEARGFTLGGRSGGLERSPLGSRAQIQLTLLQRKSLVSALELYSCAMHFLKLIYSHNYRIRLPSTVSETGIIGLPKNVTRW